MEQITFGKTGLTAGRTGFGCIPIQRIPYEESTRLLRHAVENGVNVFDTATGYTTSEDRIGTALHEIRKDIIICTKCMADTPAALVKNIENSLQKLRTDYLDVFQFHNPSFVPHPGGEDGLYDAVLKLQAEGKVRHIGISAHKTHTAAEAVQSDLYSVLQFPFSYISSDDELAIIDLCRKHNVGILGMKALCGGILSNAKAAFAFLRQYKEIVPIWGIQKMAELEEILGYENNPPKLDELLQKEIDADKKEFTASFCRACGYCLPCPAKIPIPMAARMEFLLRRMVAAKFYEEEWQENMRRISDCTGCNHCIENCPYELDVIGLLKHHQEVYYKNAATQ
ncbi:MAG: aldo/keto reductase [Defluviitaleaceae bacterium]|nr:aldo/keto reductase [Defluviitaleaceae bacterium]